MPSKYEGPRIEPHQVEWIVNDNSELGVKIGDQFFFLYKGDSLVYKDGKHDNGIPMCWRNVLKREFGECCTPIDPNDPMGRPLDSTRFEGEGWSMIADKDGKYPDGRDQ